MAGYIISRILKRGKTCKMCMYYIGSKKPTSFAYAKLTRMRRIAKTDTLFFVNEATFHMFLQMERFFSSYFPRVRSQPNLRNFFIRQFCTIPCEIPNCHNLKCKIIKTFCTFRLRIASKKKKNDLTKTIAHSSKTMTMHMYTK